MSTLTSIAAQRPADRTYPGSAAQHLCERRRHFEALLLRSFAGMRTRKHAA